MNELNYYILIFIFYSFIGWIIESGYRTVLEKGTFVNSGSLFGPFVPIYGFGATFILIIESFVAFLPFLLQLLIFSIAATVMEYLTSFILENKFSIRFWDYSNYPLNINGRVCLLYSVFWAILSSIEIVYLQPSVHRYIQGIASEMQLTVIVIFLIYISFDIFYSMKLYLHFAGFLLNLKNLKSTRISGKIRTKLQNIHPLYEMKSILRPLRVFPYLREEFSESMLKLPNFSKIPYVSELKNTIRDRLDTFSLEKNDVDMTEFKNICKDIIEHPEYLKLKKIKHHDKDIYSHNLKVAWISYITAKKIKLNVREMVRGALLHDFFFYDWHVKRTKEGLLPHGFTHPFKSVKNAERIFGRLTSIERDIIMKHMWPLTVIPPRYTESFIVSFIDKLIASREIAKDVLNTKKKS